MHHSISCIVDADAGHSPPQHWFWCPVSKSTWISWYQNMNFAAAGDDGKDGSSHNRNSLRCANLQSHHQHQHNNTLVQHCSFSEDE